MSEEQDTDGVVSEGGLFLMERDLQEAINHYLLTIGTYEASEKCQSFSWIEGAKIGIADVILQQLGIRTGPRPLSPEVIRSPKKVRKAITQGKRRVVMEHDLYRCLSCGTHKDLSIDHILPVSKGGSNYMSNLQTLCSSCNSSKGARVE